MLIVSVDGGCKPGLELVASGVIGATAQQYPGKMATLGMQAIKDLADGKPAPAVTRRPRLLQHRCRPGDRQAGRRRRQHLGGRGPEDLLGLSPTQSQQCRPVLTHRPVSPSA